jgi:iron complex outermembrane receptor protein
MLVGAAVIAVSAAPTHARAAERVQRFDIASQPAADALNDWARQAGVQVVFPYAAVEGRRTPQVRGELTRSQALQRLIANLPVAVSSDAGGVVTLNSPQGDTGASEAVALEEIVVTAQKFAEPLREVPISMSAVTGNRLQARGAAKLADYVGYIPGLTFVPSGVAGDGQLNLRGVTTATSPTAATAVYVDDVPTTTHGTFGANGYRALDLFPYDLERVEVLRGPQGTLYGDSTIGGLVKYVTRGADVNDFSAQFGVEGLAVSNGDRVGGGVRAAVNAPVVPGRFGVRISAFYQDTPGYIANVADGEKGLNAIRQSGVRLAARLTVTDALSVDAQWLHTQFDADGYAYTALEPGTTRPLYGAYKDSVPVSEFNNQGLDLFSATVRYDFGPAALTAVTGYSRAMREGKGDSTASVRGWINTATGGSVTDGLGAFVPLTTNRKFTQEVRLAPARDRRLTWLIGGYYSVENTDTTERLLPYYADGTVIDSLVELYDDEITTRYTDLSAFANATFKITDKWEISGGVRHSLIADRYHEKATGLFLSGSTTVPYFDDIKTDNTSTTWALTSRYIASEDLMVFARAASGFRAGGINYTWPGAQKSYDPDSMVSYEAGVRADFLADRASIDLTVYYLDWRDLFIVAYTKDAYAFGYQINGGRANGVGMEFTGTLRPVRGLTLTATAAYFGLRVREDLPTIGAQAGDRTPNSPPWSGSISADYILPLTADWDLSVGGGVRLASHAYSRFVHDPSAVRLDGYALVDLNAALSNRRWTLRGYVRNLTGEDGMVSISSRLRGVQQTPRTMGLALDVKF